MVNEVSQEKPRDLVKIYVMGKEYIVPSGLTIMKAMEYVGYRFIRGAGCRGGFCGACATVFRIQGEYRLQMALACQETVRDGMYLSQIPFTPATKARYSLDTLDLSENILLEHYPELARCLCCNTCTKACPQELEVMNYVQAALKGDFADVAARSFDCIACGLCAMRCPAEIVPYHIALLARRIYGKAILPESTEVEEMIQAIETGRFDHALTELTHKSLKDLKTLYEERGSDTE
jgi:heterodisulfide reductase subunit C